MDCLWGSFTMTGREEEYTWVGPYLNSRQVVVVHADSNIFQLSDLEGTRVAVQATSKPEREFLNQNNPATPQEGICSAFLLWMRFTRVSEKDMWMRLPGMKVRFVHL